MATESRNGLLAEERRRELLRRLSTRGRIEAAVMAEELHTSSETIRKDLIALEAKGLLRRVHGGALGVDTSTVERELSQRTDHGVEKGRIASAALNYLPAEGAIFIDAGSTTARFVELLPDRRLQVYTNALSAVPGLLSKPSIACHTLAGRVRHTTMAQVGALALASISDLHFDVAFVGTNSIDLQRGLATPDPEEAAIKAAMIQHSDRVILLADHNKFAQSALVRYAAISDIDVLVTSREVDPEIVTDLESHNVEVHLA